MKFVATDEVHEISDEAREIAEIHKDHAPDEHVCRGCLAVEPEECWAKRHEEVISRESKILEGYGRGEKECNCLCHQLVDQCRMALSDLENDGDVMFRLVDKDGWSVMMPSSVHEMFQQMPEDVREEAMKMILADAKSKQRAKKVDDAS